MNLISRFLGFDSRVSFLLRHRDRLCALQTPPCFFNLADLLDGVLRNVHGQVPGAPDKGPLPERGG